MYDAVGTSFDGGAEVNEENASDSPIENKFLPSIIPRYMSERSTNFNHRILVFSDNTRYRIVVVGMWVGFYSVITVNTGVSAAQNVCI